MDRSPEPLRSHLFTVRVWKEEVGEGQFEWRGKVQLLNNGEVRYFRELASLGPLLIAMISELDTTSRPTHQG